MDAPSQEERFLPRAGETETDWVHVQHSASPENSLVADPKMLLPRLLIAAS